SRAVCCQRRGRGDTREGGRRWWRKTGPAPDRRLWQRRGSPAQGRTWAAASHHPDRTKPSCTGGYHLPMLRLHYIPGTAAMAPHAALAEVGADYAVVLVEDDRRRQRPSAYLSLNPWGQVPTLEDGDLVLTEAVAIMLHIADRFPEAGLAAPVGTRPGANLSRWLSSLSYAVQTTYMHWFYPERFTTDPDGAAAIRDRASA